MEKKDYLKACSDLDNLEMELLQTIREIVHDKKILIKIECGRAPDFMAEKKEWYEQMIKTEFNTLIDFVMELEK